MAVPTWVANAATWFTGLGSFSAVANAVSATITAGKAIYALFSGKKTASTESNTLSADDVFQAAETTTSATAEAIKAGADYIEEARNADATLRADIAKRLESGSLSDKLDALGEYVGHINQGDEQDDGK